MVGSGWTFPLRACALCLLVGCASTTTLRSVHDLTPEERERLSVRPQDAPPGRRCSVSLESAPSLAELVDSAAIHANLVRQWPDMGKAVESPRGRAVFTMRVDSAGTLSWIDVHSATLSDTAVAFVSSLFPERVKARTVDSDEGPQRSGWTFRIGVDIDDARAITVSRPVYCAPQLRNEEQVRAKLNALMNLRASDVSGAGTSTLLWIMPGEDGKPRRVRVARSSGNQLLDEIAQHAGADALIRPAIADGHPLQGIWLSIPINFRPGAQRQPM